ncbi:MULTISPECIES: hypothetical protein [Sphingobacterium]|uniref:hypothetical protein n=1 Tax=Sphingobacterium TaxID=28453 RepID=UPI0022435B4F|nr:MULTISPECIES: hypothetical protein [Sphingobacterium]MCW8310726.1 hypothetical protein [Sphingobacterium sp. InxBP1]
MNTLDLKGFGVQEMDAKEMEVIDGGWNQSDGMISPNTAYFWGDFFSGLIDGLLG